VFSSGKKILFCLLPILSIPNFSKELLTGLNDQKKSCNKAHYKSQVIRLEKCNNSRNQNQKPGGYAREVASQENLGELLENSRIINDVTKKHHQHKHNEQNHLHIHLTSLFLCWIIFIF